MHFLRLFAVFDSDEFFVELAKKTLDIERVGTMLLGSRADVDTYSRNMGHIYLACRSKMIINKASDQQMQQELRNVLRKTKNGEAEYFLDTELERP